RQRVLFGERLRQIQRLGRADAGGHRRGGEGVESSETGGAEHFLAIGTNGTKMAAAEVKSCGHGMDECWESMKRKADKRNAPCIVEIAPRATLAAGNLEKPRGDCARVSQP